MRNFCLRIMMESKLRHSFDRLLKVNAAWLTLGQLTTQNMSITVARVRGCAAPQKQERSFLSQFLNENAISSFCSSQAELWYVGRNGVPGLSSTLKQESFALDRNTIAATYAGKGICFVVSADGEVCHLASADMKSHITYHRRQESSPYAFKAKRSSQLD